MSFVRCLDPAGRGGPSGSFGVRSSESDWREPVTGCSDGVGPPPHPHRADRPRGHLDAVPLSTRSLGGGPEQGRAAEGEDDPDQLDPRRAIALEQPAERDRGDRIKRGNGRDDAERSRL
jgi:hypothetical protein